MPPTRGGKANKMMKINEKHVSAILGENPFLSSVGAWAEITGSSEKKSSLTDSQIEWNKQLKELVLRNYLQNHSLIFDGNKEDKESSRFLAEGVEGVSYVSFVDTEEKILVKVKILSAFSTGGYGENGSNEIPVKEMIESQWCLSFYPEYKKVHLLVLFGGNDFRQYEIERDNNLIQKISKVVQDFVVKYVQTGVMPEPKSVQDYRDACCLLNQGTTDYIEATEEIETIAKELSEIRASKKEIEEKEEEAELKIKAFIGENAGVKGKGWEASWKQSKASQKIDWKKVAEKAAVAKEVISEFTSEVKGSRRFLFKS